VRNSGFRCEVAETGWVIRTSQTGAERCLRTLHGREFEISAIGCNDSLRAGYPTVDSVTRPHPKMRYEIFPFDNEWKWRFVDRNGEVLASASSSVNASSQDNDRAATSSADLDDCVAPVLTE